MEGRTQEGASHAALSGLSFPSQNPRTLRSRGRMGPSRVWPATAALPRRGCACQRSYDGKRKRCWRSCRLTPTAKSDNGDAARKDTCKPRPSGSSGRPTPSPGAIRRTGCGCQMAVGARRRQFDSAGPMPESEVVPKEVLRSVRKRVVRFRTQATAHRPPARCDACDSAGAPEARAAQLSPRVGWRAAAQSSSFGGRRKGKRCGRRPTWRPRSPPARPARSSVRQVSSGAVPR